MKRMVSVILTMLMALCAFGGEYSDSLLMERIFCFQRDYTHNVNGFSTNVYMKHLYKTNRRNFTLWFVPSMYPIANGERNFFSEQYNRFTFNAVDKYDNKQQVFYTTIPHNRRTMSTLMEFLTPDLYDETIYGNHILSPFNRSNRRIYKYSTSDLGDGKVRLYFRPRYVSNTQLTSGQAIVDYQTGRIEQLEMEGEFDMIRFKTLSMQGTHGVRALIPRLCMTDVTFKFAGNNITSHFEVAFDCPITLPDSVSVKGNRQLIDSIRPYSLSDDEQAIYDHYDSTHKVNIQTEVKKDSIEDDAAQKKNHHNYWKEIGWDLLGENLIRSMGTESKKGYLRMSPILDPQYVSYSASKGFSYKMRLGAQYRFNPSTVFSFHPQAGYNFKLRQFYFSAPFMLEYGKKHKGAIFLLIGNGNRIGNNYVLEEIAKKQGENSPWLDRELHTFNDFYTYLSNNVNISKWINLATGIVYHKRRSIHADDLQRLGIVNEYQSLAPLVSLTWRPLKKGPVFSIDYERGLQGGKLNLPYERWEGDISWKHRMHRLQVFNARLGGGLYTLRKGNHFMDFANFRDNNLPDGWDDDWSGHFQLLSSSLYNESKYYVRGNISYESPLLAASYLPLIGHFMESERLYASTLLIDHSRPYSELGYGFSTRFFSMGIFASFHNIEYQSFGCKFTFELFRRW